LGRFDFGTHQFNIT